VSKCEPAKANGKLVMIDFRKIQWSRSVLSLT
jgi:hypothetical protein